MSCRVREKQLQDQKDTIELETQEYRWIFFFVFFFASSLELVTEPLLNFLQGNINYSSPKVDVQLRVVG